MAPKPLKKAPAKKKAAAKRSRAPARKNQDPLSEMADQLLEGMLAVSSKHEVAFHAVSVAGVFAGRRLDTSALSRAALGALKVAIAERWPGVWLTPAGNQTNTGPAPDQPCGVASVIGLEIDSGGEWAPLAVPLTRVQQTLEKARALDWQAIAEVVPPECRALLGTQTTCWFLTAGPDPRGRLILGEEGAAQPPRAGTFFRGETNAGKPHENGVWSMSVADGVGPVAVELTRTDARYFLVSHCD